MLRLDAGNFELAVQSYTTLAVLFHEGKSQRGGGSGSAVVVEAWEEVGEEGE